MFLSLLFLFVLVFFAVFCCCCCFLLVGWLLFVLFVSCFVVLVVVVLFCSGFRKQLASTLGQSSSKRDFDTLYCLPRLSKWAKETDCFYSYGAFLLITVCALIQGGKPNQFSSGHFTGVNSTS